jgi:hypothetical protein
MAPMSNLCNTPYGSLALFCAANDVTVGEAMGVTRQAASRWRKTYIPEDRALDVQDVTGDPSMVPKILAYARVYRREAAKVKAKKLADFQRRIKEGTR